MQIGKLNFIVVGQEIEREREREDSPCLWRSIFVRFKPVFVHDPVGFLSIWCPPLVEYECFPHAYEFGLLIHRLVSSRRLPKPRHGSSVSPGPCWILLILVAEEIPLILFFITDPASLCPFPFRSLLILKTYTRTHSFVLEHKHTR